MTNGWSLRSLPTNSLIIYNRGWSERVKLWAVWFNTSIWRTRLHNIKTKIYHWRKKRFAPDQQLLQQHSASCCRVFLLRMDLCSHVHTNVSVWLCAFWFFRYIICKLCSQVLCFSSYLWGTRERAHDRAHCCMHACIGTYTHNREHAHTVMLTAVHWGKEHASRYPMCEIVQGCPPPDIHLWVGMCILAMIIQKWAWMRV